MHAFGKITLFFTAGAIYVATHKTKVSELDGIGKQMPFTMAAFAIGALSMIGIPPAAGFISKWYLLLGSVEASQIPIIIVLAASTMLNAAYFLPIVYAAFFKEPRLAESLDGVRLSPDGLVLSDFGSEPWAGTEFRFKIDEGSGTNAVVYVVAPYNGTDVIVDGTTVEILEEGEYWSSSAGTYENQVLHIETSRPALVFDDSLNQANDWAGYHVPSIDGNGQQFYAVIRGHSTNQRWYVFGWEDGTVLDIDRSTDKGKTWTDQWDQTIDAGEWFYQQNPGTGVYYYRINASKPVTVIDTPSGDDSNGHFYLPSIVDGRETFVGTVALPFSRLISLMPVLPPMVARAETARNASRL